MLKYSLVYVLLITMVSFKDKRKFENDSIEDENDGMIKTDFIYLLINQYLLI